MFTATEAIALQIYPYKDKNAVVKLYTQHFGLVSCWVNSLNGRKSKTKAANLQPFSIINAQISHKENNNLYQLKELNLAVSTSNLRSSNEKSVIIFFLCELLMRCLKETSPDPPLYLFLKETICILNETVEKCSNFHLLFLVRLCEHLGFLSNQKYSPEMPYFNLDESTYQSIPPLHHRYFEPEKSKLFGQLAELPLNQFYKLVVPFSVRKDMIKGILEFYSIHTGMLPLKSHLVLEELNN